MKTAKLPKFLCPMRPRSLIRLGRDNEGGYLVDPIDVDQSDVLVSFGINDDWSFEKAFVKRKNIPLLAYDATLNFRFLRRRITQAIRKLNPLKVLATCFDMYDYIRFFKASREHHRKFIGFHAPPSHLSLEEVIQDVDQRFGSESKFFLKLDIEGWEYRILKQISTISPRLTGLVIEFHDIDLHLEKLQYFIQSNSLKLIHVHANNFSMIAENDLPLTVECTFSRDVGLPGECTQSLPHELDMPNNRRAAEIQLSFV